MSGLYQAKRPVTTLDAGGVASRSAATVDGLSVAMQRIAVGMLTPGAVVGRSVTKLVAASNASAQMQAAADYVCDGVADQVEINAALAAIATTGGTVLLSEGTFTLAAPISLGSARQVLRGMGLGATTLAVVNAGGTPINTYIVQLIADYTEVSDLTIDGNKANNATANTMIGVRVASGAGLLVRRVRVLNSALDGLWVLETTQSATVRDCLIEGAAATGMVVRGAIGFPTLVAGCTVRSSGGLGFQADNGPVAFSDCQSLSNAAYGFNVETTATASLTNCLVQASGSYGFRIRGAGSTLTGCQAINAVNDGFLIGGAARIALVGCLASGTTGNGRGFETESGSDDVSYTGCAALDNNSLGFLHNATGRVSYVGCEALNNVNYGFSIGGGTAHLAGCSVYGQSTGSHGVDFTGGSGHIVNGCRIANNGQDGINIRDGVTGVQVVGNRISESSLKLHAGYDHVAVAGDGAFIDGNMMRSPTSGNRPYSAIGIVAAADGTVVGLNDMRGAGMGGEVSDAGTNTRRTVKLQLDYNAAADLVNNVSVPGNTWSNITGPLSFNVDSPNSIIEISCRASMQMGFSGNVTELGSRLVIDSATTPIYKKLGGEITQTTGYGQNPLGGGHPIRLTGLAVGAHTVKLQVAAYSWTTLVYLRAGTFAPWEFLNIQVTEFSR